MSFHGEIKVRIRKGCAGLLLLGQSSPCPVGWDLGFGGVLCWLSPLAMEFKQQKPLGTSSQFKVSLIFSLLKLRLFLMWRIMEFSLDAALLPKAKPLQRLPSLWISLTTTQFFPFFLMCTHTNIARVHKSTQINSPPILGKL